MAVSCILAACALAALVCVAVQTVGFYWRALHMQQEQKQVFSYARCVLLYHKRLISERFDQLLALSKQHAAVITMSVFNNTLRCGTDRAWHAATAHEGLLCETQLAQGRWRWQVTKQGAQYVATGYTFFTR